MGNKNKVIQPEGNKYLYTNAERKRVASLIFDYDEDDFEYAISLAEHIWQYVVDCQDKHEAGILKKILSEAVQAIDYDDNADYGTALWKIVELAGGQEACDLLENSPHDAFEKYCLRLTDEEEKKFKKLGSI